MHQIWLVPELVQPILKDMYHDVRLTDLARLARVSSWFWQLAAPILWEEPDLGAMQLVPFKWEVLIPEEMKEKLVAWSKGSRRNQISELTEPSVIDRFDVYRPFIKRFNIDFGQENPFLQHLALTGVTHIFPNLHKLVVSFATPTHISHTLVQSLLTPSIRAIAVKPRGNFSKSGETISSVARMILDASMPLAELSLYHGYGVTHISRPSRDEHVRLLESLAPSLRRLQLGDICAGKPEIIAAAARLPDLKRMAIELPPAQNATPGSPEKGFPILQHLEVTARCTFQHFHTFLASVSSTNMQDLYLHFPFPIHRKSIDKFTDLPKFSELKIFDVAWDMNGDIRRDDIILLLECRHLVTLKLDGEGAMHIFDDELARSAIKAWPHLQTLEVEEHLRFHDWVIAEPPVTTLHGLAYWSIHCPSLKKISIPIDARGILPTTIPTTCAPSVQELRFHISPIDDRVGEIASFISQTWPHIVLDQRRILRDQCQDGDRGNILDDFGLRWRRVWEKVAQNLGQELAFPDRGLSDSD